jgi:hypothetical protein
MKLSSQLVLEDYNDIFEITKHNMATTSLRTRKVPDF